MEKLDKIVPLINGRWVKEGENLEGIYQGRKMVIRIEYNKGIPYSHRVYMKPNKEIKLPTLMWDYPHPTPATSLKDGWITARTLFAPWLWWKWRNINSEDIQTLLEEYSAICFRIETGEIRIN